MRRLVCPVLVHRFWTPQDQQDVRWIWHVDHRDHGRAAGREVANGRRVHADAHVP